MGVNRPDPLTDKEVHRRWARMQTEQASWRQHWADISAALLPRRGSHLSATHRQSDQPAYHDIYDSTGTHALTVLAAGMLGGMTSPARPWFRLQTGDPGLDAREDVKRWLDDTTRIMQNVFAQSNIYNALRTIYTEVGAFGTAAALIVSKPETVIHAHVFTAGEYCIACNDYGEPDTLYRRISLTVEQVVRQFGLDNVTQATRNRYNNGDLDGRVEVFQGIEPRIARNPTRRDRLNMPYRSVYAESGALNGRLLSDGGYERRRILAPRWDVLYGDTYGSLCPGMKALGDLRQLYHAQVMAATALAYRADPPKLVPAAFRGREQETMPGGVMYYDNVTPHSIRSAFDVPLDPAGLLEMIADRRRLIQQAFHADLFLMLANATDTRMTATEVAERHEEKLMMLGPVIEQLHHELLKPLIDITFGDMLASGVVPPPPPTLQGAELQVQFVSMLAQAQRAIEVNAADRFLATLGSLATLKPEVLDNIDADAAVKRYADMLGIDPDLIAPGEQVALVREQRAEAQAAQAQAEQANLAADTAAKAAKVPTFGGQNLASDIISRFSGYSSPASSSVEQVALP